MIFPSATFSEHLTLFLGVDSIDDIRHWHFLKTPNVIFLSTSASATTDTCSRRDIYRRLSICYTTT